MSTNTLRKSAGRPPKFNEARRPITLTLPERTLQKLERIDIDRARAIVKAVDSVSHEPQPGAIEVIEVIREQSLIVISDCRALRKISWLRLVEISPGRFLLALPSGTPVESLELSLLDLLEHSDDLSDAERAMLNGIRELINKMRRRRQVQKAEILLVSGR